MFKYTTSEGFDFTTTVELDLKCIDNGSAHIVDYDPRYFKPIANFDEQENRQYPDQSYVIVSMSSFITLEELSGINYIMETVYPEIQNIKLVTK